MQHTLLNPCTLPESGALRYNSSMKTFAYIGSIAILFILPFTASAYTSTGARVQKINETTAIFFIDYAFGHEDHDLYLPILAERDQAHGTEAKTIGFEILAESEERTAVGSVQALALSKAPIEDGMYKAPKGYKTPFTLAVILTTSDDTIETDYAVRATDLPFYMGEKQEYQHLNVSELQYYMTPEVELNESNTLPREAQGFTISVKDIEYTVLD